MFNPCGMWVDYLHSFYKMPCKLIIGGVPTIVTLRWYKAPAGAQRLPFGSVIFSHVWDNNPGESRPGEIGEVGAPRTWDPGNNVGYQGQCYRGDPTWFQTGQLPALAGIPPSPCLCQIPPALGSGTLVLSGGASASIVPDCQQVNVQGNTVFFVAPSPFQAQFTQAPLAPFNKTLVDPQYPFVWSCEWTQVPCRIRNFRWVLQARSPHSPFPIIFSPVCEHYDGVSTGQWLVPLNSPYRAGQIFYLQGG